MVVQDFREPTAVSGRLDTHIASVCSSNTKLDSCHHFPLGFTSWVHLHFIPSSTLTHSLTHKNLFLYAKASWERAVKYIKISAYSAQSPLQKIQQNLGSYECLS